MKFAREIASQIYHQHRFRECWEQNDTFRYYDMGHNRAGRLTANKSTSKCFRYVTENSKHFKREREKVLERERETERVGAAAFWRECERAF